MHYNIDLDFTQGRSRPPTTVTLTGLDGGVYTYDPHVDVPVEPTFKVGDFVQVVHLGLYIYGRCGVVTHFRNDRYGVEFGQALYPEQGDKSTTTFDFRAKNLRKVGA